MNKPSRSTFPSPERIFFAASLVFLLCFEGYLWRSGRPGVRRPQDGSAAPAAGAAGETRDMRIEELRWIAPARPTNYRDNPFDIGFRLRIRPPEPKPPKPEPPPEPPPPKPEPLPPPPPPPPPVVCVLEYRGYYTNLAGARYAMLRVTVPETKQEDMRALAPHERFLEVFTLLGFDSSAAVVQVPGKEKVSIPWNTRKEIPVPRKLLPARK